MGYDSSTADAQFRYTIRRSKHYAAEGLPVISVDTKSLEPIDNHLIQIEPSIDAHTWEKRE